MSQQKITFFACYYLKHHTTYQPTVFLHKTVKLTNNGKGLGAVFG